MSRLVVHLNRGEQYTVEPEASAVETTGDLAVVLRNHGQPVHAHLRLDGDLASVATVEGTNHYVESEEVVRVSVADGAAGARGSLSVETGYGQTAGSVGVAVTDGDEEAVAIGEELIETPGTRGEKPDHRGSNRGAGGSSGDAGSAVTRATLADVLPGEVTPGELVVLAAMVTAALVAAAVAVAAAPGRAVLAGAVAVLVGVAVAGYLLVR